MIGVRRTRGEGADVGATNLDGYLYIWGPRSSARRGCEMGLRRAAGAGGFEPGFRDKRGVPTLPTHPPCHRVGHAVQAPRSATLDDAVPDPEEAATCLKRLGPRTRAGSEYEQRSRARTFREESSLTNEVQRRAKRVRCNAGLGRPRIGLATALRCVRKPK